MYSISLCISNFEIGRKNVEIGRDKIGLVELVLFFAILKLAFSYFVEEAVWAATLFKSEILEFQKFRI